MWCPNCESGETIGVTIRGGDAAAAFYRCSTCLAEWHAAPAEVVMLLDGIPRTPLPTYQPVAGHQPLPDMWVLKKDKRILQCCLSTHRHGWQLRLMSDARLAQRHICRTEDEVFALADEWRKEARSKGWLA
jgi:hypothetical protein